MKYPDSTPISNLAEIRRGLRAYHQPGWVYELRALGTGSSRRGVTYGYYDDLERMVQDAASLSGKARGVYFTPNPVSPGLIQRSPNTLREFKHSRVNEQAAAGTTEKLTGDKDIVSRHWFLLDFDPIRANGIKDAPATDEEEQAAITQAQSVADWLRSQGWPEPLIVASGNGCQLSYRVDLPNDEASKRLSHQALELLAARFPNPAVKLDTAVFNSSRIWKVPGTLSMKGTPASDRPHRLARILSFPETVALVTFPQLEALAAMLLAEDRVGRKGTKQLLPVRGDGDYTTLDVVSWFHSHAHFGRSMGDNKHAVRCPWGDEHSERRSAEDTDTVVWDASTGHWPSFHCSHDHCAGRTIREVMALWGDADAFCKEKSDRAIGRPAKGSKNSAADRAIDYVLESGVELFHDEHGEAFITFDNQEGMREVWPVKSRATNNFLRWTFYSREQKGLPGEALTTARGTLAAQAQFQGIQRQLALRVAHCDGEIWYDLGNWKAVRITDRGWEIEERPPVIFRHYSHQQAQVTPVSGGDLGECLELINVSDPRARLLLEIYLVAALLGDIPLPILLVHGEQGSAKTFLMRIIRCLLDPSSLATLAPPDNLREFVQQAAHHRTLYLDNLSYLPDWMSDALCRLCIGEGFSKRELYSDDDDIVYNYRGLGGITGINLVVTKSDLLDRSLILRLDPIPEEERQEEGVLWRRFQKIRHYVLGAMFDTLSTAVKIYPLVKVDRLPRLADFARWGVAIAEALGHDRQDFLNAYGVNVASQNDTALEESVVAQAILAFLRAGDTWVGTATELLQGLDSNAEHLNINTKAKAWPKSSNALTRRLREVSPNLRRAGIHISEQKTRGIKLWRLSRQSGDFIVPTDPVDPKEADSEANGLKISTLEAPISTLSSPKPTPLLYDSSFDEADRVDKVDISPTSDGTNQADGDTGRRRMSL